MRCIETVLLLVVLGTVVAAFAGKLRIPAPSLLVIAGLLIGLLPGLMAMAMRAVSLENPAGCPRLRSVILV